MPPRITIGALRAPFYSSFATSRPSNLRFFHASARTKNALQPHDHSKINVTYPGMGSEFRLYQHLGDLNQNVSSIERRLGNIELAQTSAKDEESRFLKKLDQPNPPWRTPLFSETEKKPDLFDAKMDRVLSRVGKVVREGEWWFLAVLLGLLTFHGTMLVLEVIEIFRERLKQDLNELRKSYKEAGA